MRRRLQLPYVTSFRGPVGSDSHGAVWLHDVFGSSIDWLPTDAQLRRKMGRRPFEKRLPPSGLRAQKLSRELLEANPSSGLPLHTYRYHARNHGTAPADADHSIDALASDLAHFLDREMAVCRKVSVVGTGMGAYTALHWMRQGGHHRLVERFHAVIVDIAPPPKCPIPELLSRMQRLDLSSDVLARYAAAAQALGPDVGREVVERVQRHATQVMADGAPQWRWNGDMAAIGRGLPDILRFQPPVALTEAEAAARNRGRMEWEAPVAAGDAPPIDAKGRLVFVADEAVHAAQPQLVDDVRRHFTNTRGGVHAVRRLSPFGLTSTPAFIELLLGLL